MWYKKLIPTKKNAARSSNFNLTRRRSSKTFHAVINIHFYRVYKSHDRKSVVNNNLRCLEGGAGQLPMLGGGRERVDESRRPTEFGVRWDWPYDDIQKQPRNEVLARMMEYKAAAAVDAEGITFERWWAYKAFARRTKVFCSSTSNATERTSMNYSIHIAGGCSAWPISQKEMP